MATPDDPGRPREPYGGPQGGAPGGPSGPPGPGGGPYGGPPYGGPPYGGPLPPPPGGPAGPYGGPWEPQRGGGLGTAAFVLGICSLVLLLVCGVGTVLAIVGLVLGIVAIARNSNRRRAVAGVVLSVLTLLIALVIGVLLYNWFQARHLGECFDRRLYPTQEDARRCVEEKLGGAG